MAQPIFPDIEMIMTILMGEMPEGPYAQDRADDPDTNKRSFSSSEIRAHAQYFANQYANLLNIYQNKFLTTVNPDGIGRWEKDLFQASQNANLPFLTRKANAISKYRAQGGLSYPYLYQIISSVLTPVGLTFDLVSYNCYNTGLDGAWILDLSQLDVGTYIGYADPLLGAVQTGYTLDCFALINTKGTTNGSNTITAVDDTSHIEVGAGITGNNIPPDTTVLSTTAHTIVMSASATGSAVDQNIQIQNYVAAGLTQEVFEEIQATAYTYEVRIYGTASPETLSTLDQLLTINEKATVTHVIKNNFPPPVSANTIDLGLFTADTLIDNIDCGLFLILPSNWDVWDMGSFT